MLCKFGQRNIAPVATYQQRQLLLFLAGKAGQIRVLNQIGSMLVIMVMGNIQPYCMGARRPAKHVTVPLLFQLPFTSQLLQQLMTPGLDQQAMLHINMTALHQGQNRALTHIFVLMPAKQVIQCTFAQRTIHMAQTGKVQSIKHRFDNGQSGRKNTNPFGFDTFNMQIVNVPASQQLALEQADTLHGDAAITQASRLAGLGNRLDSAGSAYCLIPAKTLQRLLDLQQFQPCRCINLMISPRTDGTARHKLAGKTHTANRQTAAILAFKALSNNELGAAATNINSQPAATDTGQAVGNTEENQARFFTPGNHINTMTKDFL